MTIIISTLSVFLIMGAVLIMRKKFEYKICPICIGVAGTWLWILIGIYSGFLDAEKWKLIAAMFMGGSVVGIAYQLERRLDSEERLTWKALFIPVGFVLVYGLINLSWMHLILSLVGISLIAYLFLRKSASKKNSQISDKVAYLEKKMKNCC
ncbi:MAG: hypothetical protein A3B91_01880 [Candidatus Yanofskybacteria bacterium RIFCSPHIGHO2_02_FULL_41_29]|uniref:Uncharacterized protein n=1 Tax=Candidatus Yanofskybacteria bacterium RIFCSPHIGHO2_01_FULL_41_53 TaxID=1802663 RepID=A0A1F8EH49_9BACT|nr:MAG: hypothetical protein A2650_04320 [Candidatus Yanofskybacteria bacterium RIFCSPHIGHO2_01_FULL_41_53]OGN11210.1 MAG: hypothetical protein A3B91_01880 [Candidatus Yanofskybacteria bacterium RIFCSPHIGHO2_02_FULL_41_29]OGN16957.1 MAG: hypothetical protein A3F48_00875 [Candidatus Yanofskybacteria bacterium RIFCSPHIGHO2_12_FULL_41_9]OGN22276.1 MAG: hypothetical protein A2916_04125 [Candidatus Yanofskybacteria bacterium RIFCSPLOWO2_01_FULL_41_67]OGN29644.1 MAG: hypothetical protein A3H54_00765 